MSPINVRRARRANLPSVHGTSIRGRRNRRRIPHRCRSPAPPPARRGA